jgi:hypothetical protein
MESTCPMPFDSSIPDLLKILRFFFSYLSNSSIDCPAEIRDDRLVMLAPGMTYDMRPLGGGQFEAREPDAEHRDKYIFRTSRSGEEFEVEAWEGGAPAIYRAVKGSPLEASRLKEYSGTYSNDELRRMDPCGARWQAHPTTVDD